MGWAYSTHSRHDKANEIVFGVQNVCCKLNSNVRRLIYCVRKFLPEVHFSMLTFLNDRKQAYEINVPPACPCPCMCVGWWG